MNGRELPVKIKPILHLSDEDLNIGEVSVGDNISLEINAKVKGIAQNETEKNKEVTEYTFEIHNAVVSSGLKKTPDMGETLEGRLVK